MGLEWYARYLKQTITYWAFASGTNAWNDEAFVTPVTLSGRWETTTDRFMDLEGNEVVSNSIVYLNQDVTERGFLYLGESVAADPKEVQGAYPIRKFQKVPTFRLGDFMRKAYL